jgi:hypothetical protein
LVLASNQSVFIKLTKRKREERRKGGKEERRKGGKEERMNEL